MITIHKRLPLPLVLGIVFAAIAVIMIKLFLDRQRLIIREQTKEEFSRVQERQATVILTNKDLPSGTTIESSMLKAKTVPREFIQPQAVSHPDRIIGMVTIAPLAEGEQITLSKLIPLHQAKETSLAMATPVGKRAISIPVDNLSSLLGMVRPGDYVDVIAMMPVPAQTSEGKPITQIAAISLFQNVLILAVDQEISRQPEGQDAKAQKSAAPPGVITLALTPQEANLIAFVLEHGKIRLVLRSPADSQVGLVQPASWESLFRYALPQLLTQPQPGEPEEAEKYIEIYRGLTKDRIPITK